MRYAVAVFALFLAGCGGPNIPDPAETGDVSGTWAGTYSSPQLGAGSARLGLAQSASSVSGTWSTTPNTGAAGNSGSVNGTNPTRGPSGVFTADLTPSDPRTCAFRATMTFQIPQRQMTGQWVTVSCTVAASGTFSLTKQ